jgi:DNA-binding PadR family transcriptional regulator
MTNAELAILSLLAEQPRHGYELENAIETRGMRDWTEIGFSSIYYILKKLEGQGWIQSRLEQGTGRGPARRVFTVTQAGMQAWQEGNRAALSEPQNCHSSFQLGLAYLPSLPPQEARSALGQYRQRLAERRAYVLARREAGRTHMPPHVEAMFDLSLTLIDAELGWVENYLAQMETGNERED